MQAVLQPPTLRYDSQSTATTRPVHSPQCATHIRFELASATTAVVPTYVPSLITLNSSSTLRKVLLKAFWIQVAGLGKGLSDPEDCDNGQEKWSETGTQKNRYVGSICIP